MQLVECLPLVKRGPLEHKFTIQHRPGDSIHFPLRHGSEARVARHNIVTQSDRQVVQFRSVRAPRVDALHLEVERTPTVSGSCCNHTAILAHDVDSHWCCGAVVRAVHKDCRGAICGSLHIELPNVLCRRAFEPHSLPDATAGPVENVLGILGLLANRNNVIWQVSWIEDEDFPVNLRAVSHLSLTLGVM